MPSQASPGAPPGPWPADAAAVRAEQQRPAALAPPPRPRLGQHLPLLLDGAEVARWVRTAPGVRPVVAHAAWRTTPAVAAAVVLASASGVRTPRPLREARRLVREARAGLRR